MGYAPDTIVIDEITVDYIKGVYTDCSIVEVTRILENSVQIRYPIDDNYDVRASIRFTIIQLVNNGISFDYRCNIEEV